jgi:outer membrane lipoprotein-sorting protein
MTTAFLLYALSAPVCAGQPLLDRLKSNYSGTTSMSFTFDLEIFWKVREKTDRSSGAVVVAPGDKFRVEAGGSLWVSDGTTYWEYTRAAKQVIIQRLTDIDLSMYPSRIVENYLSRYPFAVSHATASNAMLTWHAPADSADLPMQAMIMWADPSRGVVTQARIIDKSGNESTYAFKKTQFGIKTAPAQFTLAIPEGTSVLDKRE